MSAIVLDNQHLIDTLHYRVQVQKTLPQKDVRLRISITALVHTRETDQQGLLNRIRTQLESFIHADWGLFNIERHGDAMGYERVTLKASARIPHTENYNLKERARLASHDGLALTDPEIDYGLSAAEMDKVLQELRVEALAAITEQTDVYNRVTGRTWRLGKIEFGIPNEVEDFVRRTSKGAYRAQPEAYVCEGDESGGLTAAERIVLIASVTLKAAA
jgi:hypothetical protein